MDRYAVLQNNVIVNVILWDGISNYSDSESLIKIPNDVGIGFELKNKNWIDSRTKPEIIIGLE